PRVRLAAAVRRDLDGVLHRDLREPATAAGRARRRRGRDDRGVRRLRGRLQPRRSGRPLLSRGVLLASHAARGRRLPAAAPHRRALARRGGWPPPHRAPRGLPGAGRRTSGLLTQALCLLYKVKRPRRSPGWVERHWIGKGARIGDEMSDVENVIIIGSGPAGYTAALYTARANLKPLVIEGFAWGGLLQQTTDVENYPGFPDGIMGPEMMQRFRDQAERFGAKLLTDQAERVQLTGEPGGVHSVWVGDTEYRSRTVVLAMGAEHRKLGVVGEEELAGRGVSYCATCDAAFFRDAPTM